MNAKAEVGIEAQVNNSYRLTDASRNNGFRTIQHSNVTKQYAIALSAIEEEHMFLNNIGKTEWPDDMDIIRRNLQ